MKNRKRGFSLAELVLCFGIISIITAMGITVSKHTTTHAYDKYWINGYSNLYNVLATVSNQVNNQITNSTTREDLAQLIHPYFSDDPYVANSTAITAKNGIIYNIAGSANTFYAIDMTVPQTRTRQNQNATATTRFIYSYVDQLLVPVNVGGNYLNLQNRMDLLPFYMDDGIAGRQGHEGDYTPMRKQSYIDAHCDAYRENYSVPTKLMTVNINQNSSIGDGESGFYGSASGANVPPDYSIAVACP